MAQKHNAFTGKLQYLYKISQSDKSFQNHAAPPLGVVIMGVGSEYLLVVYNNKNHKFIQTPLPCKAFVQSEKYVTVVDHTKTTFSLLFDGKHDALAFHRTLLLANIHALIHNKHDTAIVYPLTDGDPKAGTAKNGDTVRVAYKAWSLPHNPEFYPEKYQQGPACSFATDQVVTVGASYSACPIGTAKALQGSQAGCTYLIGLPPTASSKSWTLLDIKVTESITTIQPAPKVTVEPRGGKGVSFFPLVKNIDRDRVFVHQQLATLRAESVRVATHLFKVEQELEVNTVALRELESQLAVMRGKVCDAQQEQARLQQQQQLIDTKLEDANAREASVRSLEQTVLDAVAASTDATSVIKAMRVPSVCLTGCAIQEAGLQRLLSFPLSDQAQRDGAYALTLHFRESFSERAASGKAKEMLDLLQQKIHAETALVDMQGKHPPPHAVKVLVGLFAPRIFHTLPGETRSKLVTMAGDRLPAQLCALKEQSVAASGFENMLAVVHHEHDVEAAGDQLTPNEKALLSFLQVHDPARAKADVAQKVYRKYVREGALLKMRKKLLSKYGTAPAYALEPLMLRERLKLAYWCVRHGYPHAFLAFLKEDLTSLPLVRKGLRDVVAVRAVFPEFKIMEATRFHQIITATTTGAASIPAPPLTGKGASPTPSPAKSPTRSPAKSVAPAFIEAHLTAEDCESYLDLGPITGLFDNGVPTLDVAIDALQKLTPEAAAAAFHAKQKAKRILRKDQRAGIATSTTTDKNGLNCDEIAAINIYTQNFVYILVNQLLRAEDRGQLKPLFPYLCLLLTALLKLPSVGSCVVYRGVKGVDLRSTHEVGDTVTWYNFSSCTRDGNVAQSAPFLGLSGPRTVFAVSIDNGKDISRYSCYKSEKEVLIVAGTCLKVQNSMEMAGTNGCVMINLKEEKLPVNVKMIS